MLPNKPTWILVARRPVARIYSSHGAGEPLSVVREFDNPRGRLKAGEIESDRPGRSFDRAAQGRHAMSAEESPTERIDHEFALDLSAYLDKARSAGEFDRLVLVAAPKLLGKLRAVLSDSTAKLVHGTLAKDLIEPDEKELREQLAEVVKV